MDTFAFEYDGKSQELFRVGQLSVVIGEVADGADKYKMLINADGLYGEKAKVVLEAVKEVLEPRIGRLGDTK